MAVIVFGGQKGGTGKTTQVTNMTVMRLADGFDTLLLDADPQSTSSKWVTVREEEGVEPRVFSVQKFGKGFPAQVQDLKKRYDDIIIDVGGRDSVEFRYSLAVADRVYIPVLPSDFDTWTIRDVDRLVEEARAFNPELEAYILISRAHTNPKIKEAEDTREDIIAEELDCLGLTDSVIYERIVFRKASKRGRGVCEVAGRDRDKQAEEEVKALYREVFADRLGGVWK